MGDSRVLNKCCGVSDESFLSESDGDSLSLVFIPLADSAAAAGLGELLFSTRLLHCLCYCLGLAV